MNEHCRICSELIIYGSCPNCGDNQGNETCKDCGGPMSDDGDLIWCDSCVTDNLEFTEAVTEASGLAHVMSVEFNQPEKAKRSKKSIFWMSLGVLFIIGLISSYCEDENQDATPSEVPATSMASPTTMASTTSMTPTTSVVPTTTEAAPTIVGLPVYPDPDSVLIAQRLLVALGEPVVVDGVWGPATEEAWNELRSEYGLNEGGLDSGMWRALLRGENESWREPSSSGSLEGLMVPSTAVLIKEKSSTGQILESAEYVLPHQASYTEVVNWYEDQYLQEDINSWNWCTARVISVTADVSSAAMFYWWQGQEGYDYPQIPNVLRVNIIKNGNGRVDIRVTLLDRLDTECDNPPALAVVTTSTTTTTTTTTAAPTTTTTTWEPSPLMRCEIGQHLPSCLALAGVSRFTYNDCATLLYGIDNRGIDFQENWYVWDVYDDKLTVSLSPYGCL